MKGVSRISVTEDIALVTFSKIGSDLKLISDIFNNFADEKINIDMISQTASSGNNVTLSFTVPCTDLIKVLELTNKFREKFPDIKPLVTSGTCKIQLYGVEMRDMYGVAACAISSISKTYTELVLITTSEVDISLLVTSAHLAETIEALENDFGIKVSE